MIEKKHLLLIFVPVMTGGLPNLAFADNTETAKLVTEDAFPVDTGSTELEFSYQYVTADTLFDNDGEVITRGDLAVRADQDDSAMIVLTWTDRRLWLVW